jgi:hypothetical protein
VDSEHNVRRGRDSNGQSTEWITAQVCLLFRWPQLFPWTSSRRGPPWKRRRHHALLEPTPELHVEPTHATRHAIELKVDAHFKPARETT